MNYTIYPKPLSGVVSAPSSKSITHRVLICASFSEGQTIIENPLICDDTITTIRSLENIGVAFKYSDNKLFINPPANYKLKSNIIDCKDSGTSIRMLLPILGNIFKGITFCGSSRLIERLKTSNLNELNFEYLISENSITVKETNKINNLTLHDDNTSQIISGVLLSIAIIRKQGILHIISNNEELNPYIILTLNVLSSFGTKYEIKKDNNLFTITINKHLNEFSTSLTKPLLNSTHYYVEGDYSASSNLLALGLLGENIVVKNLYKSSLQGDKSFLDIISKMNGELEIGIDAIKANKSCLIGTEVNLDHIPDLGPILIALASISKGTSTFTNYERLKIKESNRFSRTIEILKSMGADISYTKDKITVIGKQNLEGGVVVNPHNDHRLAMMATVLTSKCLQRVTILNAECVNKSYPNFWEDYRKLKGLFVEANLEESND